MVTGADFLPGATTTLGGVPATSVVLDAAHIQLTAPPLAAGTLNDLTVTNPGGHFRTWPDHLVRRLSRRSAVESVPVADVERIFRQGLSAGVRPGSGSARESLVHSSADGGVPRQGGPTASTWLLRAPRPCSRMFLARAV